MGKKDESSSSSSSSDSEKEEKKDKKEKKEKTPKQKKAKQVIASNQTFSKRYAGSFNNKTNSDFTVHVGNETIHAHKLVLASNSDFFAKHVETESSFTFPTEDDAETAKSLLKFYYSGQFEYTEDSAVLLFTLLANKYKTKHFTEFKLPAKVLLNGIITYVEKDLTNRVAEFDSLCESVDFKKMEKEDLTKLYAKKKWLQKSSSFLNQIILKDMSDDEEGSDKSGSDKSGSEEEEEEEEEEEGGGGIPKFLPKLSSNSCTYSNKFRTATYTKSSWAGTILASKSNKWATKLGANCGYLMVGMAPKTITKDASNYSSNGYYLYTSTGGIYGTGGLSNKSFTSSDYNQGTIYGFVYDKKKGTLTIYKNGQKLGVAVDNIKKLELFPAFDFYYSGATADLVKFKGK